MRIPEFVDTISDDLIFLREAREALITHPLRIEPRELVTASFCRLFVIVLIQSVELMLKRWREDRPDSGLDAYFGSGPNTKKIASLSQAFESVGVAAQEDVLQDFLAIKYLRNAIVHSGWKEEQRSMLVARGFPEDARELGETHWAMIVRTYDAIMVYLGSALLDRQHARAMPLGPRDDRAAPARGEGDDLDGVLFRDDFSLIARVNIERINELAQAELFSEKNIRACYELSPEAFPMAEAFDESQYRLALLKTSRSLAIQSNRYAPRVKAYCEAAADSWRLFWNNAVAPDYDLKSIVAASETLSILHESSDYGPHGVGPILGSIRQHDEETLRRVLEGWIRVPPPLTSDDVVQALLIGKAAYRFSPNLAAVSLFGGYALVIDWPNSNRYVEMATQAIAITKLARLWYAFVEHRAPPDLTRIELYEEFAASLRAAQ